MGFTGIMISVGMTKEGTTTVTDNNTAASMVSGAMPVFATPAMIMLIEKTAFECTQPFLGEGESTVGTYLDIKHTAASPVGAEIKCRVEIVEIDRSRLVFETKVRDEAGEIGSGRHERFIINNERFLSKVSDRLSG